MQRRRLPISTLFPYTTLFRSRGHEEAQRMGAHIAAQGLAPDLAVVSTARRTQETWSRASAAGGFAIPKVDESRSEEHTSELQSRENLVCRLLLEKKKTYAIID